MNIPRINNTVVKDIINSDISNKEKAKLIHDFDYDCCLRATSKPVYRGDLIGIEVIEKELDKNER